MGIVLVVAMPLAFETSKQLERRLKRNHATEREL